jgi:hypothetical protein
MFNPGNGRRYCAAMFANPQIVNGEFWSIGKQSRDVGCLDSGLIPGEHLSKPRWIWL